MQVFREVFSFAARLVSMLNSAPRCSGFRVFVFLQSVFVLFVRIFNGVRGAFARALVFADITKSWLSPQTKSIYIASSLFLQPSFDCIEKASRTLRLIKFNPSVKLCPTQSAPFCFFSNLHFSQKASLVLFTLYPQDQAKHF